LLVGDAKMTPVCGFQFAVIGITVRVCGGGDAMTPVFKVYIYKRERKEKKKEVVFIYYSIIFKDKCHCRHCCRQTLQPLVDTNKAKASLASFRLNGQNAESLLRLPAPFSMFRNGVDALVSTWKRTLEMIKQTQFLGQHPNGSFFIIKDVEKIARSVADEDGFAFFEFVVKNENVSLRKVVAEAGAASPPADLEIRTVKVDGQEIPVTTLTAKAKAAKKAAEEKIAADNKKLLVDEHKNKDTEDRKRRREKRQALADEKAAAEAEAVAEAAADAEKIAATE